MSEKIVALRSLSTYNKIREVQGDIEALEQVIGGRHVRFHPPQTMELPRIYCVVAATVQHPLCLETNRTLLGKYPHMSISRSAETRTIVQPVGRQAAQIAHAVRRMAETMQMDKVRKLVGTNKKLSLEKLQTLLSGVSYVPITTITLSVRDSFELRHVYDLLRTVGKLDAYMFEDENFEAYGEGQVETAFATVPVPASQVCGILDYLPLFPGGQL